jgi:hypothetical protein
MQPSDTARQGRSNTKNTHDSMSMYSQPFDTARQGRSNMLNRHGQRSSSKLLIYMFHSDTLLYYMFHMYDWQLHYTAKLRIHLPRKHTATYTSCTHGQKSLYNPTTCMYRYHTPLSNKVRSSLASNNNTPKGTPIPLMNPLDNIFQRHRLSVCFHSDNRNQLDISSWYSPLWDLPIYILLLV